MSTRLFLAAALSLAPAGLLAQAGSQAPPPWQFERTPELLRLARASQPVQYLGAGRSYSPLVFECHPASKVLTARLETSVKTSGYFTTRFDQQPATTYPGRLEPEWQPGTRQAFVLRVPAGAMPQFVTDARTSRVLMFRHEFGGVPVDVRFDLTGFEKHFAPLAEGCGVGPVVPRPASAMPAARKPVPKPERRIGPWLVRESVSTVDDKLVVVVSGQDARQTVDLYIRCREGAIEAYFVQPRHVFMADQRDQVTIDVAADEGQPVRHTGPTTPLNKAAFVDDGRAFVSWLAGKKTLTLTYVPWHKPGLPDVPKTATFSLARLDAAVQPVLDACVAP